MKDIEPMLASVSRSSFPAFGMQPASQTLDPVLLCLDAASERGETTGGRALCAGLAVDRVGFAVMGGYDAALRRLLAPRVLRRACFCVTEEGGGHPRAMTTRLEPEGAGFVVSGVKTFATLAHYAEHLVVVATLGVREDQKNDLRVVVVKKGAPGVVLRERPPLPFAPEIPHARLELTRAPVSELLPGDGFERYVKPFRTVEDTHVTLAIVGYAIGEARAQGWDDGPLRAIAARLVDIADERDPASAETHLLLDAALTDAKAALDSLPWTQDRARDSTVAARWTRDRPMLDIASKARAKRTERARGD